jgi:hypothetical protein
MLGFGEYANTSRLMNDNVRQFKGQIAQIAEENIKLKEQAKSTADLDDLRNIGQEFAIKGGKDLLISLSKKAYKANIPFTEVTPEDLDKIAGQGLEDFFRLGQGLTPSVTNQTVETGGFDPISQITDAPTPGQPVVEPRLRSPDGEGRGAGSSETVEMADFSEGAGAGAGAGAEAGVEAGEEAGKLAGKTAITEGVEVTGQSIGAGLDATGILAPLGALVSLGTDIFTLFEAGKSAVDVVQRDITKTAPQPTGPQIPIPTQPLTLAQQGYGITPSIDTFDIQHGTTAHGW